MSNKTEYWTMSNGEQISVDDMSVEHLRNTLKMIIRNDKKTSTPVKKISGNIDRAFLEDEIDDEFRYMENADFIYGPEPGHQE